MKAVYALALTLLSACASLGGGSGGSAPAGPSSYGCAAQTVQRLGYHVFDAGTTQLAGRQAFTAVKRITGTPGSVRSSARSQCASPRLGMRRERCT